MTTRATAETPLPGPSECTDGRHTFTEFKEDRWVLNEEEMRSLYLVYRGWEDCDASLQVCMQIAQGNDQDPRWWKTDAGVVGVGVGSFVVGVGLAGLAIWGAKKL